MDHAPSFTRHLARLVWQLLNQGDAYGAELASLQLLVGASRVGPVAIGVRDGACVANGVPVADAGPEMVELASQLSGHSIVELTFDRAASPTDLLLMARILATPPAVGDGGRDVTARIRALDARSVTVRIPNPAMDEASEGADALLLPTPDIATATPEAQGEVDDEPELVPTNRLDEMFEVFASSEPAGASPDKLFVDLDAAVTPQDALRELDVLLKVVAEASARARHEVVAELLHGLVVREAALENEPIRRRYGVALRRAAVPPILRSVAKLLPRHRERHDVYMAVLARCEDAGAEALSDALIAAPSISDRRVYYDALIRLRSGIRTVIHMLGDSRWYVVRNAAELLGELKVAEAESALTPLLEHVDDRVRSAAAGALARIGSGPRGRVRRAAVVAAAGTNAGGHGPGSRSVNSLIRALEREADTRVQVALIAALGQLGTSQAVDKLVEIARTERGLLARQRPTPLRVAAVHALGQARAANAQLALQALLRDKSAAIRGAASWVILGRRDAVSA